MRGLISVTIRKSNFDCDADQAVAFTDVSSLKLRLWINNNSPNMTYDGKEIVTNQLVAETHEPGDFLLQDLLFDRFPSISRIPSLVENVSSNVRNIFKTLNFNFQQAFDCGSHANISNVSFNESRIALSGQFPFHVAIFRDQIYSCGGSLISSKSVVTTAHCMVNKKGQFFKKKIFQLLFGSVDLKVLKGTEALREIEKFTIHSDYKSFPMLVDDIALIIIKGNLQFSRTISPICLFDSQSSIIHNFDPRLTFLGFSKNEAKDKSSYLKYGQMSIISRRHCVMSNSRFGFLTESAFCAMPEHNMTVCKGDIGGE